MENNISKTYLLEESKSGHLVPVVDGVYMHSMLDPIKEANSFAEQYSDEIQKNPMGIVLGVGFGYHFHALIEKYKLFHGDKTQWKLAVIESDPRNILNYLEYQSRIFPEMVSSIQIFCAPVEKLYQDKLFLDLLLKKPQIIPHKPSYQKDLQYYHSVLKFKRNNSMKSVAPLLNRNLKEYFQISIPENLDYFEYLKNAELSDHWDNKQMFSLLLQAIAEAGHAEK
ncbi:MAG: hypothetical protein QE271_13475 [Bacteriovoracaceae bacterium]|nr:hypothetical protein [Bacteriovoracaceae bacterium]